MEDNNIIELFFQRSENAIAETSKKYGRYCRKIAYSILQNSRDTEECVNDTYLKAWNSIPPQKPNNLAVFLSRITRNLALDKYRSANRIKRGKGQTEQVLDELSGCLPLENKTEAVIEDIVITETVNNFLSSLSAENRTVFVRRYWYMDSIQKIAHDHGYSISKVKMSLMRSRNELKILLEKEGIIV